jgi:hypothetical protein
MPELFSERSADCLKTLDLLPDVVYEQKNFCSAHKIRKMDKLTLKTKEDLRWVCKHSCCLESNSLTILTVSKHLCSSIASWDHSSWTFLSDCKCPKNTSSWVDTIFSTLSSSRDKLPSHHGWYLMTKQRPLVLIF